MKTIFFKFILLCLSLYNLSLYAQEEKPETVLFKFKFIKDSEYKIHSVVNEKVYINGKFNHEAQIINRITAKTKETGEPKGGKNGWGVFSCTFMTSEQNSNKTFNWSRNYPSVFKRDERGLYTISDEYFMPVVRNLPVFPHVPIKKSDTWIEKGYEVHDFRDSFGIETPFKFPIEVEYQYIDEITIENVKYHHITAKYNFDYKVPANILKKYRGKTDIPVKMLGFSNQNLYWDNEKGNLIKYDEEFDIKIMLYSGNVFTFTGSAYAEVMETVKPPSDTEEYLKKTIEDSSLENTNVKKTEEGITISVEKIEFLADSAILQDSEKAKLKKIVEILSKFSDREFLVSGHTALAGTKEERQKLSEERAAAVANYLIELGLQTREHIYTRGLGAEVPIEPNTTAENKAKNRRVEITILD